MYKYDVKKGNAVREDYGYGGENVDNNRSIEINIKE